MIARNSIFLVFSVLVLSTVNCLTYDNAIIYHKYFKSGTHPLLRFDGYYSELKKGESISNDLQIPSVKPVFFYGNGSSFSVNNSQQSSNLENLIHNNQLDGSWGNYLIIADTIQLEKFQLQGSNYQRIILKGIISKDQIHWTNRKDHNESFKPVDYTISFVAFPTKPDSTKNFTRTRKKYNQ